MISFVSSLCFTKNVNDILYVKGIWQHYVMNGKPKNDCSMSEDESILSGGIYILVLLMQVNTVTKDIFIIFPPLMLACYT